MRIAYFQTAFLGDLLLSVPTLRAIQEWCPEAKTTVFCRKGLGPLIENLPFVHRAIEVDKKNKESRDQFQKQLAALSFDILFCPHESFRSARWVAKIKAVKKIGFHKWWNAGVFDIRVRRPLEKHDVFRQMSLLATVAPGVAKNLESFRGSGNQGEPIPDWASMTLPAEFWQSTPLGRLEIPSEPYICLAPGSVWNTKRWTPRGFEAVAVHYKKLGFQIFFLGSPAEAELCESLAKSSGGQSLAGKLGLWQVPQFLSQGTLMISNDSGAQHMASLAGIATVSVFGPTVLSLGYRPWQTQATVVEDKALSCRPCGKHGHMTCPIGTHACMVNVSAEMVIHAADRLLERSTS